ncbi:hypothetical protein RFI_21094, partial [Reticulomyxa filosa]
MDELAMLLEEGNLSVDRNSKAAADDPYEDLMDFMRSIVYDTSNLSISNCNSNAAKAFDNTHLQQTGFIFFFLPSIFCYICTLQNPDPPKQWLGTCPVNVEYHDQCVRVMIAAAIARGSLGDMLAIVRMILHNK